MMKMLTLLLGLLCFAGCNTKIKPTQETPIVETETVAEAPAEEAENPTEEAEVPEMIETDPIPDESGFTVREPNDEELNEYGIITAIEDSGYPMSMVSVSFPEREMNFDFLLNEEDVMLSHGLMEFLDQYATIYYEIIDSNDIMDIIFEGQSLLGEYAPEDHEGLEKFEGTLKRATSASGDLPSTISVAGENETLDFEYFVDEDLIAINGQKITVYYYQRARELITYMELSVD